MCFDYESIIWIFHFLKQIINTAINTFILANKDPRMMCNNFKNYALKLIIFQFILHIYNKMQTELFIPQKTIRVNRRRLHMHLVLCTMR